MNASTMYSKDTALSSGKQQSRRDEAAEEEEEKKENSVQKDKVRFKGLPEVNQTSAPGVSATVEGLRLFTVWLLQSGHCHMSVSGPFLDRER